MTTGKTLFFQESKNCWQSESGNNASLLIDCATYYRALYYAFTHAKHSIFIIGWDIDSRIELLRGKEAEQAEAPVVLFDLIKRKAEQNPHLQIYLNRWNYSIFLLKEREPFSGIKWRLRTPKNVHFCSDHEIPISACHHQKVIIVDDKLAFSGGMDIALGRWDQREHSLHAEERQDPGGAFMPVGKYHYNPYHDIQVMMQGPIVRHLAELVRARWKKATGREAIAIRDDDQKAKLWPPHYSMDFENVPIAVARTVPRSLQHPPVKEIQQIYLDEIARAKNFVYIENQYLTFLPLAHALNRQLKKNPHLRVLMVSSKNPQGIMEAKAMWSGRAAFYEILREGIPAERVKICYPEIKEANKIKPLHIHAKLMIIDEQFLHIGSANMNNRSMGFDTECDIILQAENQLHTEKISQIRNDLIREHTGWEYKKIQNYIDTQDHLNALLDIKDDSRQHLEEVDDSAYKNTSLGALARRLGDPKKVKAVNLISIRKLFWACVIICVVMIFLF